MFVTSSKTLRTISSWQAHADSILGIEEAEFGVITHGRDNKLHVWPRPRELPASAQLGGSAAATDVTTQSTEPLYSMDVNALNYCRFSLLRTSGASDALVALPNLVDSSCADIWTIPACERLHAAIGKSKSAPTVPLDGRGDDKTGIIMSLHLFLYSTELSRQELRLLCAFENGGITLRHCTSPKGEKTVEGRNWDVLWTSKLHVESIMAMGVTRDHCVAFTVSADHLIGRYDLNTDDEEKRSTVYRTKHPGNGCVALRDDGRVCAVGGWDGSIRLYSTKSLKPLGTLRYHKTGCQAILFAHPHSDGSAGGMPAESDESNDSDDEADMADRQRWVIAGGKDSRLSIWSLASFVKAES